MELLYNHLAMDVVRTCGCDELIDPDPTKFNSNQLYYTCHLYNEDTTINDLIEEVLCDVEVVDTNSIQETFDIWMKKVVENLNASSFNVNRRIDESPSRQLQEGILNQYEYADLEYITRLWIKYKNSANLYNLGCSSRKKKKKFC